MLAPTKPVKSCECGSPCGGGCCCTKESIGLGNVDNTSDLNKPLSRDMINALNGKVGLDVFTQLKNRVLALENSIPDITALENRMTNAESNIVTLQSNYANLSQAISNLTVTVNTLSTRVTGVNDALVTVGTRVDALEAKDSNNVKLNGVNVQTIQGTLKTNDPANGATDKTLVTANWVSQTGDDSPNNLFHKTGNETVNGITTFNNSIIKTNVSYGRDAITFKGAAGNCYIYKITDINGRSRGGINHQSLITDNHQTRFFIQLQSDNYDTTARTGAVAYLGLELLQSGILKLTLNTTTGDGKKASKILATLTPS